MIRPGAVTFIFSGVGKIDIEGFACEDCHLIRLVGEYVQWNVVIIITHYSLLITNSKIYQVVIAAGSHLFPFRTEKLSPPAPMVLQCNAGE